MKGIVFDIKELGIHDGPGMRTTVFLKGCPLSCVWCHNPEGLESFISLVFRENICEGCGLCRIPCNHSECREVGRCLYICPNDALSLSGYEIQSSELAEKSTVPLSFFDWFKRFNAAKSFALSSSSNKAIALSFVSFDLSSLSFCSLF